MYRFGIQRKPCCNRSLCIHRFSQKLQVLTMSVIFVDLQEMVRQKEKLLMDRLHQAFRRSESQLISVLERRKGEVKVCDISVSFFFVFPYLVVQRVNVVMSASTQVVRGVCQPQSISGLLNFPWVVSTKPYESQFHMCRMQVELLPLIYQSVAVTDLTCINFHLNKVSLVSKIMNWTVM